MMYRKPDLSFRLWAVTVLLLLPQGLFGVSPEKGRSVALGVVQSPKGVGFCADFYRDATSFRSLALTADLIDILDGSASTPGVKMTYYLNMVLKDWSEGKYAFYAGPGLMAGYVRDLSNHLGFAGGVSGDIGFRALCLKGITVSVEFQVDFALQFKSRYTDMSLYRAGYSHSYLPYLRIQYSF
jgi:hypothetical protein